MNELFFSDEKSSTTRPHDHVSYSINSISSPTISLPYVDVVNDWLIDLLCCGGCCCCCYCSDLQSILNHHMNTNRQHTNTHTQLNWMHFFVFIYIRLPFFLSFTWTTFDIAWLSHVYRIDDTTMINLQDVLCGRGGHTNHHPGNEWYVVI